MARHKRRKGVVNGGLPMHGGSPTPRPLQVGSYQASTPASGAVGWTPISGPLPPAQAPLTPVGTPTGPQWPSTLPTGPGIPGGFQPGGVAQFPAGGLPVPPYSSIQPQTRNG